MEAPHVINVDSQVSLLLVDSAALCHNCMVMDLCYWALSRGIKIILCFLILKFKMFFGHKHRNWSRPGCDFFPANRHYSFFSNAMSGHKVFELTIGS